MRRRWLSTKELAEAISVRLGPTHPETVRKWAKKGCPHGIDKHGHRRFLLEAVLLWYLPSHKATL